MSNKEPDRFKSDLQHMASGYEVPVQQEVFNLLMDKRAHQNKQKKKRAFIYFSVSLLLVVGSVLATIYITKPNKSALHSTALLSEKNQSNRLNSSTKINLNNNKELDIINGGENEQTHQPNIKTTKSPEQKNLATASANLVHTKSVKNLPTKTVVKSSSNAISSKPKNTVDIKVRLESPIEYNNLNKEGKSDDGLMPEPPTSITKTEVSKADSVNEEKYLATPVDSATKAVAKTDTVENKPIAEQVKWRPSYWLNTTWYPVSALKNDNSKLPNHLADSFGLSNAAHSTFNFSGGVLLPINKSWSFGLGIGYYQLNFDRIRITDLPSDTSVEGLVVSSGIKGMSKYQNYTSEITFKYLEVPVFVRWEKQNKKSFSPYVQTGFTYDYLLSSASYIFEVKQLGEVNYTEKENAQQEQFITHRFGVQAESGFVYKFNSYLAAQAGVAVKQDLRSLYLDGSAINKGTFVGLRVGLKINLN